MFFTVSFRLFFHVCFTAAKNVSLNISNYLIQLSYAGRLKKKKPCDFVFILFGHLTEVYYSRFSFFSIGNSGFSRQSHLNLLKDKQKTRRNISKIL